MRYSAKVINSPNGLEMKETPNSLSTTKATIGNNASFIVVDSKKAFDGSIWFQDEGTSLWIPYQKDKKTYVKLMVDLERNNAMMRASSGNYNRGGKIDASNLLYPNVSQIDSTKNQALGNNLNPSKTQVITPEEVASKTVKPYVNSNGYPKLTNTDSVTGKHEYLYYMDTSDITKAMNEIKKDMNIPFGDIYTIPKLNKLMHTQFNRYRVVYPDYERQRLIPYVFFTRPDLNFFQPDGSYEETLCAAPQLEYLVSANPMTAKCLTLNYTSEHQLNPLLCNRVASFDVADDTLETTETGETFTGYKMKYGKDIIRSVTGGSLSIKFPETYNLGITTTHQLWVGYENAVYRGYMNPKKEYITGKILDYACDIYYFLADSTGVIWFWSQIFGAFPTSVNKSVFSYDEGSLVTFPSVNITYEYWLRKDWEPDTIVDFNINAGIPEELAVTMNGFSSDQHIEPHMDEYIASLGHSGRTWAGPPFIEAFIDYDGSDKPIQRFRIRHRKSRHDIL